ncbi:SOS response-associated peptidase family protein [Mesorhizobium sp. M0040]|uniref:SOS response-associated peptidase family protein n=1 Tax=Mesorhizobium sp. M0040 TaxID=2956855 RepID=UPI003337B174
MEGTTCRQHQLLAVANVPSSWLVPVEGRFPVAVSLPLLAFVVRNACEEHRPAAPVNLVHDRQPLILDPAYYDHWLDPKTPTGDLKDILSHDVDGNLQFYRVGREVNAAAVNKQPNDYAGLIEPIALL